MPHVTMKDIARRAGVSTATVSMSLRNQPGIGAGTRDRIAALARRLGYRPNPYVSALMRSRRQGHVHTSRPVVALVNGLDGPDAWRTSPSDMRRRIREGALERAVELGYQGQEFWLHQDGMTAERFSEMLHTRGIQGLLLGPRADETPPPDLRWEYFSAVSLSVPSQTLPLHGVCNDHYFSSWCAVRECHRLGYHRPGLVLRRADRDYFQGRWEAGFFSAQQSLPGLAPTSPLFIDHGETNASFRLRMAEFARWLKVERPDVIIMSSLGIEALEQALRRLGWQVPRDIGLVGLSCPALGHRISGIYQNGRLIGATAMDILVGRVERHEKGLPEQAITTMVESLWNPGATLRPQTAAVPRPARVRGK